MPVQHSPPQRSAETASARRIDAGIEDLPAPPPLPLIDTPRTRSTSRTNSLPSALEANPRRPLQTRPVPRRSQNSESKGDLLKNRQSTFRQKLPARNKVKEQWYSNTRDALATHLLSPRLPLISEATADELFQSPPPPPPSPTRRSPRTIPDTPSQGTASPFPRETPSHKYEWDHSSNEDLTFLDNRLQKPSVALSDPDDTTETHTVVIRAHTPLLFPVTAPNNYTKGFVFDQAQLPPPKNSAAENARLSLSPFADYSLDYAVDILNTGHLRMQDSLQFSPPARFSTSTQSPLPNVFSPAGIVPLPTPPPADSNPNPPPADSNPTPPPADPSNLARKTDKPDLQLQRSAFSPCQGEKDKQPQIVSSVKEKTMATSNSIAITEHRLQLQRISEAWTDEFDRYVFENMPASFIGDRIKDALSLKKDLEEALLNLRKLDPHVADLENGCRQTKSKFMNFIIKGQEHLVNVTPAGPVSGPSAPLTSSQKHKKIRVEKYEAETLINLDQVANEIEALFVSVPTKDRVIKDTEERFISYTKKAEMIVKDGAALCSDAADVGLELQAGTLETSVRKVKTALLDGQSQLGELKSRAGLFGSSNNFRASDVKPPTFSGDGNATSDYFSFHKEYFEFADSRSYTNIQHLHTLKKTCLTGTAKLACSEMDSVEEIFKYLKRTYGNPNLLLVNKVAELRRVGTCPTEHEKKRDWLIKVQQQLKQLIKMATEHKMLQDLYFSDVLNTVHAALPYKTQLLFRESIEQMDWGELSRQEVFTETIAFIDQQVEKASSDIKLSLMLGMHNTENKNKSQAKVATGRTYPTIQVADKQEECESEDENQHQEPSGATKSSAPNQNHTAAPTKNPTPAKNVQCKLCSSKHEFLFYCEKYQKARVRERFQLTRTMATCVRCLRMDSELDPANRWDWWQKHQHNCTTKWECKEGDCKTKQPNYQFHFTMCTRHIKENKTRGEGFLRSLEKQLLRPESRFFFNQTLNFCATTTNYPSTRVAEPGTTIIEAPAAPAIFMLQNFVAAKGETGLMFYDSGCSTSALSDRGVRILETEIVTEGPTKMGVAGGKTIEIPGGEKRFWLRTTKKGEEATMVGTHMPEVTTDFPIWELTAAYNYVKEFHKQHGHPRHKLPQVPDKIGGVPVDVMIGIQNNKFFPKLELFLPCGLALYTALFLTPDGNQGVLGGPHESWIRAGNQAQMLTPMVFFSSELRALRSHSETIKSLFSDFQHLDEEDEYEDHHGHVYVEDEDKEGQQREESCYIQDLTGLDLDKSLNISLPTIDMPSTPCKSSHCIEHVSENGWSAPPEWYVGDFLLNLRTDIDKFENLEDVGTSVSYRCLRCRNCAACRNGESIEKTSLEEEADQAQIDSSVWFNPELSRMEARLPFKKDPVKALQNNRFQAERMLRAQLRAIAKRPGSREDVFKAHNKLRDKGHVMALSELKEEQRKLVEECEGSYYIPWSIVCKPGSVSSPFRVVFNASMKTASGESLNSILAKGINKLPKILDLLNRFGLNRCGFVGDISMAYNMVKLLPAFWTFQRYLWAEGLNINDPAVDMVVCTLIYGVTPSGGLMTSGFRSVADHATTIYPQHAEGASVLRECSYVDDILHAAGTLVDCQRIANSLNFVLQLAGMQTKGFTFSGSPPPETVSTDGESVGLLGYIWWPEQDLVSLAAKDLALGKSSRGRAPTPVQGELKPALKAMFTRRVLSGKVSGVYDPRGLATPITARIKVCLSQIVDLKIDWDDQIPMNFLDIWVKNIEDIQKLSKLRFERCFLHPEAVSDVMDLLVVVDASKCLAVAAVYARSSLGGGKFGCRLICAKSKLVHLSTIPRGELRAAVLGATLAHSVKQSMGDQLGKVKYFTDSTIVMHWLNQDQRPLHTLVRNSVIEVRRLSSSEDWFHIESANNIADLGTRECELAEIDRGTPWQRGLSWMSLPYEEMPTMNVTQIKMTQAEQRAAALEVKAADIAGYVLTELRGKVADRHRLSNYLVDPTYYPWKRSVRIMGFVLKFIKMCKDSIARKKSEFFEVGNTELEKDLVDPPLIDLGDQVATETVMSAIPNTDLSVLDSFPPPSVENLPIIEQETLFSGRKNVQEEEKIINLEGMNAFLSRLRPDAPEYAPSLPKLKKFEKSCISDQIECLSQSAGGLPSPPGNFASTPLRQNLIDEVSPCENEVVFIDSTRIAVEKNHSTRVTEPIDHVTEPSADERLVDTSAELSPGGGRNETCFQLSQEEIQSAENYFFCKATGEVEHFSKKSEYESVTQRHNGILYYKGRILEGQQVDDVEQIMTDLEPLSFIRPICDRWSPVSYAVMVHSHANLVHHRNAAATLRESRSIVYIIRGRDLANEVREACPHCRRFKAKLLQVEMGNIHRSRLRIAAPFFTVQCDLFGPYTARCEHNHRSKVQIWGVLFKCPASGALSACAMSKYDTGAFIQAYGRHAYRYGHPVHLYVDAGSQILKACRDMEFSMADISHTLNSQHDVGIKHTVAPVLGHNQIGMVERSVLEVKKLFDLVFGGPVNAGLRLDTLSYETAFQYIANELNSLPICLGSKYENLDHTDLITPSRLILGRNNRRAPTGYTRISSFSRQVQDMDTVHRAWWKVWNTERLADYIPRPSKWSKTSREPEVDDMVLYLQEDKEVTLGKTLWRMGRVFKIKIDEDTHKRNLNIQYKNAKEKKFRYTWRTARKVAIIFREGDLELIDELNNAARDAAINLHIRIHKNWSCKSSYCARVCMDADRHAEDVLVDED